MSALPDTPVTLIARMAAQMTGEDEARWVRFFDLYQPVIRHFAQAAGAKTDSEDVAQDVLVKLVEVFRRGTYTPEKGRFRAYLAAITRREVINRWQKAQARAEGRHVPIDDVQLAVPPEAAAMLDAKWRLAQHAAAVEHVLTKTALSDRDRAVYRAYVQEGRPIAEVAAEFKLSRNSVSQIKTRIDKRIVAVGRELVAGVK